MASVIRLFFVVVGLDNLRLRRSAVAANPGRALRYAKGSARSLLHHPLGHDPMIAAP